MANLKSGFIDGSDEFINIETLFELNLEADKKYEVQIQKGALVCESETKPDGSGFYWNSLKPFVYKKESAYLWIKVNKGKSVYINISE